MNRLYDITASLDSAKSDLYVKNNNDYFTYFNSFCLHKWKKYTTITQLRLCLKVTGSMKIVYRYADKHGEVVFAEDIAEGDYSRDFSIDELLGDIVGFSAEALEDGSKIESGGYWGEFSSWSHQQIGVGICTYKREKYVLKTMQTLADFISNHKWLQVLVVDNGATLDVHDYGPIRVFHNRNYGGSGGFTRALLEYVKEDKMDYVLLMDDDIILEPSAIERMYALLCGLKAAYRKNYLGGAMLSVEKPTIQYENTAYWNKIKSHVNYHNLDLTKIENLVKNGVLPKQENQYAGWWFCCMPLQRIKENGYPLPLFIKTDDMEYSIRNGHSIMNMNGIGVWHETFVKKMNPVIVYHSDRNSLILNHYVKGGCAFYAILAVILRLAKSVLTMNFNSIKGLSLALRDYLGGIERIVDVGSDCKMRNISNELEYLKTTTAITNIVINVSYIAKEYSRLQYSYQQFIIFKLKDNRFWIDFLK